MLFFDFLLQYGLKTSLATILLIALLFYMKRRKNGEGVTEKVFGSLIVVAIAFRFLDAILKTVGQYYLWAKEPLTKVFLNSGLSPETPGIFSQIPIFDNNYGYFIFYALTRFWFNVIVVFAVSFLFSVFLGALKKKRVTFFDTGEVKLGVLTALLVGWPQVIILIPVLFLSVVLLSIFRSLFLKKHYTTLGYPLIFSSALIFVLGNFLGLVFNISVFNI